jgi:tellurite resistance protein
MSGDAARAGEASGVKVSDGDGVRVGVVVNVGAGACVVASVVVAAAGGVVASEARSGISTSLKMLAKIATIMMRIEMSTRLGNRLIAGKSSQ